MTIKVLIVDDSALIRRLLTEILSSDDTIEVVGTAPDPYVARDKIKALQPDVLTLDLEMPRMDGLSFLERLMTLHPMPVLVVSTLTQKGADTALRALELGAVDCMPKPLLDIQVGMLAAGAELIAKVKTAAHMRPCARHPEATRRPLQLVADPRLSTAGHVIAIGASTGGVEALQHVLPCLPATAPAIVITQHMPPGFTASFAERMDRQCAVTVSEATDGRKLSPGHVFIAPGARHLEVVRSGAHFACRVFEGPPVSGHAPSVDVLFASVAVAAGRNGVGVILTGMGRDGADGLLAMRRAGARTIGQTEASALVYGMPKVAMQQGAVETELPLDRIAEAIMRPHPPTDS